MATPVIKIPFQYLPTYAKVSIERMNENDKRSGVWLDTFLDSYAKTYGIPVDADARESAFAICARRFGDTFTFTA